MTARDRVLTADGECCRCREHVSERLTVALVDGGSGPGWSQYACFPCARTLARSPFAPAWLKKDVASLDAQEPRHLRSVE